MSRAAKTWRTWTRREEDRASELRLGGATLAQVAVALGRSLASVKCRAGRFDKRATRLGRYLPVLMRPHTIASAAAELGVSKWAVKQAKRKLRKQFDIPNAEGHCG